MFWSTINIDLLSSQFLPMALRDEKFKAILNSYLSPLQKIADDTLYKMQHNGTKIYLEKMLNESYGVVTYNNQNHSETKLIYIEDITPEEKLFVWQNEEVENVFLEDDAEEIEEDIFLDDDTEGTAATSFVVYMPDTISFTETELRALIDSYRYIGKKYTIQIYTP